MRSSIIELERSTRRQSVNLRFWTSTDVTTSDARARRPDLRVATLDFALTKRIDGQKIARNAWRIIRIIGKVLIAQFFSTRPFASVFHSIKWVFATSQFAFELSGSDDLVDLCVFQYRLKENKSPLQKMQLEIKGSGRAGMRGIISRKHRSEDIH